MHNKALLSLTVVAAGLALAPVPGDAANRFTKAR